MDKKLFIQNTGVEIKKITNIEELILMVGVIERIKKGFLCYRTAHEDCDEVRGKACDEICEEPLIIQDCSLVEIPLIECINAQDHSSEDSQTEYVADKIVVKKVSLKSFVRKMKSRKSRAFIKSDKWKIIRSITIGIYGSSCMCCGKSFEDKLMNVDHIKPRSKYPRLMDDFYNLQVLCVFCNFKKGIKETDYRPLSVIGIN